MREIRYHDGRIEIPALHIAETPQMPREEREAARVTVRRKRTPRNS